MANSKDIVDSIRAIKKIQEADTSTLPATVTGNAVAQSNGNPIANQGTRQPTNQGTKDITNNNNNNQQQNDKELPQLTEGMINYFLFSANPFLPGVSSTQAICNEYKKLPNECNPIIIVSNSGGDGAFDINCFASFKNHKFGASFPAKDDSATVLTSFKTFAKIILDKIGGNNNGEKQQSSPETSSSQSQQTEIQDSGGGVPATINESTRNRMLNKILREGDSNQTLEGKGGSAAQTIKGANKFGNNNVNLSHGIKIYTDSYYLEKLNKTSEFSKILNIEWKDDTTGTFGPNKTPIILDTKTLSGINADSVRKAGTEIFQSILEYINGKKSGTASARGTADTVKSQKMNESTLLKEGDDGENHTSGDWSWENIKVNQGAKQYLSRLYGSVEAIKKGLDDGGNPSMISRIGKRIASEIGKTFGSALTDGADLMMQGFGLGWMMPLIKAGIEEFQKENDNKQYEGIEAWVRDPSFAKISQYFGNPKDFIEGSGGTK